MMQSKQVASSDVEGCGARLRQAREGAGLTIEEVSSRLKMPLRVIRALEADDWSQAGAPVFVRGQLRSYARLLGINLDSDLRRAEIDNSAPPELISHTHTPRYRRVLEQAGRRAVYIALTAVIALPVWLTTRPHFSGTPQVESLEIPAVTKLSVDPMDMELTTPSPRRTPLIASMGSLHAPATVDEAGLSLRFNGDSWVQVFGPDGRVLEQGLIGSNELRSYEPGQVSRIVLGNVSAVEVRNHGESVDLAPFSRANVARFTLSSEGSLAPVTD